MDAGLLLPILGLIQALGIAYIKRSNTQNAVKNSVDLQRIDRSFEVYSVELAKIKVDINEIKTDVKDIKNEAFKEKLLNLKYMQTLENGIEMYSADLVHLKNAGYQKGLNFISFCKFVSNSVIGLNISSSMTKQDLEQVIFHNMETVKKKMGLNLEKEMIDFYFEQHKTATTIYMQKIFDIIFHKEYSVEKKQTRFNYTSLQFLSNFLNKLVQSYYIFYK